jgi:hypothetical protein
MTVEDLFYTALGGTSAGITITALSLLGVEVNLLGLPIVEAGHAPMYLLLAGVWAVAAGVAYRKMKAKKKKEEPE